MKSPLNLLFYIKFLLVPAGLTYGLFNINAYADEMALTHQAIEKLVFKDRLSSNVLAAIVGITTDSDREETTTIMLEGMECSKAQEALLNAVYDGKEALVALLVLGGTSFNSDTSQEPTYNVVHFLSQRCPIKALKLILQHSAHIRSLINEPCPEVGWTPLHFVTRYGTDACIDLLLEYGATPNVYTTFMNQTPLHFAAQFGNYQMIRSLLESGASLEEKDITGSTALHLAVAVRNKEVVQVLSDEVSHSAYYEKDRFGWKPHDNPEVFGLSSISWDEIHKRAQQVSDQAKEKGSNLFRGALNWLGSVKKPFIKKGEL